MKYIVLALLFASAAVAYQTFAPGEGPFAHLTPEEFAAQYLMQNNEYAAAPTAFDVDAFEAEFGIDSSFDLREENPQCVSPIRDQAGCGGCWAFAITSLISDRECFNNGLDQTRFFSPQHFIDCADEEHFVAAGCQGADTQTALQFADVANGGGLRDDACYPYVSGETGEKGTCHASTCSSGEAVEHVYSASHVHLWNNYDNNAMAREIQEKGTIYMSMQVHEGFMKYKGGVYRIQPEEANLGGHAIRVIGWGKDDIGYFWIAANQWTDSWGEDGYFRIGFNEYIGYKAGAVEFDGEVDSFVEF